MFTREKLPGLGMVRVKNVVLFQALWHQAKWSTGPFTDNGWRSLYNEKIILRLPGNIWCRNENLGRRKHRNELQSTLSLIFVSLSSLFPDFLYKTLIYTCWTYSDLDVRRINWDTSMLSYRNCFLQLIFPSNKHHLYIFSQY